MEASPLTPLLEERGTREAEVIQAPHQAQEVTEATTETEIQTTTAFVPDFFVPSKLEIYDGTVAEYTKTKTFDVTASKVTAYNQLVTKYSYGTI